MIALAILPIFAQSPPACVVVRGDRILIAEIADAVPAFRGVVQDLDAGPAPLAGMRRHVTAGHVRRLAAQYGIDAGDAGSLCVERESWRLDAGAIQSAIRRNPAASGFSVEVVAFSRHPLPVGDLDFPVDSRALGRVALGGQPVLWRGSVRTLAGRSVPVWARIRLTPEKQAPSPSDASVHRPAAVRAGQEITVEVTSGAVRLKLPGVAEFGAGVGHLVAVRSLSGKARLQGVVKADDLVEVNIAEAEGK